MLTEDFAFHFYFFGLCSSAWRKGGGPSEAPVYALGAGNFSFCFYVKKITDFSIEVN